MRPKKAAGERRDVVVNIRLTVAEGAQFRAQASARKMELAPYLRSLALTDGESLATEGKVRQDADGNWEIYVMGSWHPC